MRYLLRLRCIKTRFVALGYILWRKVIRHWGSAMNKRYSADLWRSLNNWYITGWRLRCPCKSQQAKAEHGGSVASLLFLFFFVVHRRLRSKIARILGSGEAISLAGLYSISPIW